MHGKQSKRFDELEGLRGVAAVMVVLYHFMLAFYLVAFYGPTGNTQHMRLEDNLYGMPFMAPFSGVFMVAIFFVLSGFVLSIGFFQTGKESIVRKLAAKRYIRLMLPALASVMIAFVLLAIGLVFLKEQASGITQSKWLITEAWVVQPNFLGALQSGVIDTFIGSRGPYNNVLWTMVYEFFGSFLIFGFLLLFGKLKYRWIGYIFLMILTFNTWFMGFVIGMAMADLYANGYLKTRNYKWWGVALVGVATLFLGGYPMRLVENTPYQYVNFINLDIEWRTLHLTIAAAGVVGLILLVKPISTFFQRPFLSKLGKYTFALYLIHLSILFTFSMAIFLLLNQTLGLGYNWSVLITIVLSIPVIIGATVLFERYIDAPSVRLSARFADIFLGYSEPPKVAKRLKLAYRRTVRRISKRLRRQAEFIPEEAE